MNLEQVIIEQVKNVISSGKIEEVVSQKIEKTIIDILDDQLRSYSDFGKAIKEKIKESINIDPNKLSFPEYQEMINSFIVKALDENLISAAKEKMEEQISKFFKPLEKDAYCLSDIVDEFKKELDPNESYQDDECTIIVENGHNDSYYELYLDKSSGTERYSCRHHIRINEKGIWALSIDDSDMTKYKGQAIFGFDRFLFQLYASGCKIEIDETEFDTYLREEY